MALYGEFVESQRRFGRLGEVAFDPQHRTRFGENVAVGDLLEYQIESLAGSAGQKSQVTGIDAHHRNRGAGEPVHAFEQRAVAAVTHHDAFGRLRADAITVAFFRRNRAAGQFVHEFGELGVDRVVDAEPVDGFEKLVQFLGRVGDLPAGKK